MSIFLQKAPAAVVARQNKWSTLLGLGLLCLGAQQSRAEAPAQSVSKVTASSPSKTIPPSASGCELLSRGPDVQLLEQEALLHSLLQEFIASMREGKYDELKRFFHSRAKVASSIGDKIRTILINRYDQPLQFSVYRVWRLRSAEAGKAIVRDCPESEGAALISQFGYEKQFAIWLQIMGQNELGRLILAVAPEKGRMAIVGLRVQQWTQQGSDWETWTKQAQTLLQSGDKVQAYFAFDVAQKLLKGEDFVLYPNQKLLKEARDQIFSQGSLVNQLNEQIKTQSIAYVGSLLTKEGTGILLRETVSGQEPTRTLQELCQKRARSLQDLGWLKDKQGLRCNYIFAGMDPNQDSELGGFYLSPSDLKIPQK